MKKNDLILIAILIFMALLSYIIIRYVSESDGGQVEVVIDGKVEESFSLNEDITYKIFTDSENYNILEIKDGVVRVSEANCPDELCVTQNSIDKAGESIICLPHKLVIRITGTDASEVDAIAD